MDGVIGKKAIVIECTGNINYTLRNNWSNWSREDFYKNVHSFFENLLYTGHR